MATFKKFKKEALRDMLNGESDDLVRVSDQLIGNSRWCRSSAQSRSMRLPHPPPPGSMPCRHSWQGLRRPPRITAPGSRD